MRHANLPFIILVLAVLLLTSCSKSGNNEVTEKTEEKTPAKEATQAEEAEALETVVACEDTDGSDIYTKGKVILSYSNGQKESFKDSCLEEGSVFPVFLTEYTCNNLNASSKLYKCDRNCSSGACNR